MTTPDPREHPAWYGSVMGTGALSLTVGYEARVWDLPALTWVAGLLLALTSLLAIGLLPRYLRRLKNGPGLRTEMGDPARGPMLATLPAGLLVLGSAWGNLGPDYVPLTSALILSATLAVIGAVIAVAYGVLWLAAITEREFDLDAVNGAWLIPPVMNLLVPLPLAPLIAKVPAAAPSLTVIALAFWGVGLVLFLAMFALVLARLALRAPTPAQLAPSIWVPLAPMGVSGVALTRVLSGATGAHVPLSDGIGGGVVVLSIGIGVGLWWSAFAWFELRRTARSGELKANPGWWGFVFPIGAMALAIVTLGTVTQISGIEVLGALATLVLAAVWVTVAARTLPMVR